MKKLLSFSTIAFTLFIYSCEPSAKENARIEHEKFSIDSLRRVLCETPIDSSAQVKSAILIEEKLQKELAHLYANRDFAEDMLDKIAQNGEVNKPLNDQLTSAIEMFNNYIAMRKYKGIKYLKEDYLKFYEENEKQFYGRYPYLK